MTVNQLIFVAVAIAGWYFMFRYGKTSAAEARRLVAAGARLVDVRTPAEFAGGSLPGAVNVPLGEIEGRISELKKGNKPVVLFCASGMRSAQARRVLNGAGIADVYDLGSLRRW